MEMPILRNDSVEDLVWIRAEEYGVDDGNEPAPENEPHDNYDQGNVFFEWESKNVCNRKSIGHREENVRVHKLPMDDRRISWFLHFFPMTFLRDAILSETNKN